MTICNKNRNKIICLFGFGIKFDFIRVPFGLANAPSVFHPLMKRVLSAAREIAIRMYPLLGATCRRSKSQRITK